MLQGATSHTTVRTGPYTAVRRVKLRTGGEARQAEGSKEGLGQGLADRRFMTEPPRAEAATGDSHRPVASGAPLARLLHAPCEPLPLGPQHRPQRVTQSCSAFWNYSAAFIFSQHLNMLLPIYEPRSSAEMRTTRYPLFHRCMGRRSGVSFWVRGKRTMETPTDGLASPNRNRNLQSKTVKGKLPPTNSSRGGHVGARVAHAHET